MAKTPRHIWLLSAVAVIVGSVLVLPYVLFDVDTSRIETSSQLHYGLLVAHVFTAFIALVLGPLQFIGSLRARRKVHRVIGRTYLFAGVVPAALTGIPVALLSGRLLTQIGLAVPAVLWLVTGWLAYRAARRRDFTAHRAWMMRNYALTFLAVTARILVPLFMLAQLPFRPGVAPDQLAAEMIPVGQALSWIVNLVIVEYMLRRRELVAPRV